MSKEIKELLLKESKNYKDRLINLVADRPGHDFRYAINSNRITSELNWKPRFSFEEGLVKTIKWYANNKDWWKPLLKKN